MVNLEVDLEKEGFGDKLFLSPAAMGRGVTFQWVPNYLVVVSGDHWYEDEAWTWLHENCNGLWKDRIFYPQWLIGFELQDDAIRFKLIWG